MGLAQASLALLCGVSSPEGLIFSLGETFKPYDHEERIETRGREEFSKSAAPSRFSLIS